MLERVAAPSFETPINLKEAADLIEATPFEIRRLINTQWPPLLPTPVLADKTAVLFDRQKWLQWFSAPEEVVPGSLVGQNQPTVTISTAITIKPSLKKTAPEVYGFESGAWHPWNACQYQLTIWRNQRRERGRKRRTELRKAGILQKKKRLLTEYIKPSMLSAEKLREKPQRSISEAAKMLECSIENVQEQIRLGTLKTVRSSRDHLLVDFTEELTRREQRAAGQREWFEEQTQKHKAVMAAQEALVIYAGGPEYCAYVAAVVRSRTLQIPRPPAPPDDPKLEELLRVYKECREALNDDDGDSLSWQEEEAAEDGRSALPNL